jgi:hypothetical protein
MRGEARTDFSVRHSRTRETVPPPAAKGANTTGEAASAPLSLVDELAAWGERSLPLESLIFRAVPFPPADPPPPSGKRPAPDEGMEEVRYGAGAKSDPRPGPLNNFSRADIDLLARKVIRLIQRQERLERESKGML